MCLVTMELSSILVCLLLLYVLLSSVLHVAIAKNEVGSPQPNAYCIRPSF